MGIDASSGTGGLTGIVWLPMIALVSVSLNTKKIQCALVLLGLFGCLTAKNQLTRKEAGQTVTRGYLQQEMVALRETLSQPLEDMKELAQQLNEKHGSEAVKARGKIVKDLLSLATSLTVKLNTLENSTAVAVEKNEDQDQKINSHNTSIQFIHDKMKQETVADTVVDAATDERMTWSTVIASTTTASALIIGISLILIFYRIASYLEVLTLISQFWVRYGVENTPDALLMMLQDNATRDQAVNDGNRAIGHRGLRYDPPLGNLSEKIVGHGPRGCCA